MSYKEIRVLVGTKGDDRLGEPRFNFQINKIFNKISDLNGNGGHYYPVTGRFKRENDYRAYCLVFYCEQSLSVELISYVKDVFNEVQLRGVQFVSVKEFDCESHSFELGN